MKALEDKILSFNDWSQPWTFYDYVDTDKSLKEADLRLFNQIWTIASSPKIWNNGDLTLCAKASQDLITSLYKIKEEAVASIVRAISYQWR